MPIPVEVDQFLSGKRARKADRRRWRQTRESIRAADRELANRLRFGERSRVIRMLGDAYPRPVEFRQKRPSVRIPRVFSIIEDPGAALNVLLGFARSVREHKVRKMEIDQSALEIYDLAANSILDIIATEMMTEARHRRTKIRFTGRYPRNQAVNRFIRALGIIKHLEVEHETIKGDEKNGLHIYDARNAHYREAQDPLKADLKSRVSQQFVDH